VDVATLRKISKRVDKIPHIESVVINLFGLLTVRQHIERIMGPNTYAYAATTTSATEDKIAQRNSFGCFFGLSFKE
jgi:hypothetical protein